MFVVHKLVRCGGWFGRIDQGSVVLVGRNALGQDEQRKRSRGKASVACDLGSVMGDDLDELVIWRVSWETNLISF